MPLLHWLTRDTDIHAASETPYRLLEEVRELSCEERDTANMLIQGDNLDTLKALLPYYAGKVKCIFIDPPYNTRSAFEHYDDNLEHTKWLAMIYPRLELLRELLSEEGSIWVTIDDNEAHYLKVIMDEIFGRKNFVANVVWQKRYSRENREAIGDVHDHILLYVKSPEKFKVQRNLLPLGDKQKKLYKNPNNDPRGLWQSVSLLAQGYRPNQMYEIIGPTGKKLLPPPGNCWKIIRSEYDKLLADNRVYFGKDGTGVPRRMEFLSTAKGLVPWTWWPHEEVGHTDESKKESNEIFGGDISFGTPKPERLILRILQIATNPNDLVLDSFLGSGTTAAVAHKMGRRYIGIEMGDHAMTHCAPRLQKVIEGEQGGISEAVGWKGGGGFRFYRLGVPVFDESGHVAPEIRFAPLAAHIWFLETGIPYSGSADSPLLGSHEGIGYYLLYNGILGDNRPEGGNVLTTKVLACLPPHDGPKVIFGEGCLLSAERLKRNEMTFRQIPYDIKAR
jgi:adenine-specific DNA-methyltransferase